ncbi:testis-expressed protein 36 [Xyrauchen texanus]|uniref:testis-expressed protein 36 n=1 Tax=Xyrauchen texanus TaxID=154827 RepID=UPI00224211CF|nr:testis-expressed protein 36 [Xyrauchen texanus]
MTMDKQGKKYFNKNISGNWFMHTGMPQTEPRRELCTSTGSMLAHGVPKNLTEGIKRYPKIFNTPEKKTMGREYPFSVHDNRTALQNTIHAYEQGVGRKKCLDERRQHNSHYCLCHRNTLVESGKWDHSAYDIDFLSKQETECTDVLKRRFPRNHSSRSQINAAAHTGECFMWFGRADSNQHTPLSVLAEANHSVTAK